MATTDELGEPHHAPTPLHPAVGASAEIVARLERIERTLDDLAADHARARILLEAWAKKAKYAGFLLKKVL